jgi:UPF0716 protein FxsA
MPILLALLLIPLAEIAVFIQVGREIGLLQTLALLLADGLAGVLLLRLQGFAMLARLQQKVVAGEPPVRELFDAACLALAGLLLLLPGFLSDLLALLLLVPPVRALIYGRLVGWVVRQRGMQAAAPGFAPRPSHGPVIEGDWTDVSGRPLPGSDPHRREDEPNPSGGAPDR